MRAALRIVAAAALAAALTAVAPAASVKWHISVEAALKAARKSGRPVYVFVYLPYRANCWQMDKFCFHDATIARLMKNFECAGVNAATPGGAAFVDKHKLAKIRDPNTGIVLALVPAHLFLKPDGSELHRQYGYTAPPAFKALLERVLELYRTQKQIARKPSAALYAKAGHLLLVLGREDESRRYLSKAIDLGQGRDPEAVRRARLDLAILAIKRDPDVAIRRLRMWLDEYGDTPDRCEAEFYLATAYVKAGKRAQAEQLLLKYMRAKKGSPEAESIWGARARRLYRDLKKQAGRR